MAAVLSLDAPVVSTKLRRPELPDTLLSRPRLSQLLASGSSRALTLVQSPPGFGKTVAVGDWVRRRPPGEVAAWLTLAEKDNDPLRFWLHLTEAVEEVLPGCLAASRSVLQDGRTPEGEFFAAGLVNELCLEVAPVTVVLDNFEHITDPAILEWLGYIVQSSPPNFHYLICTRLQPELPLARWRAAGLLHEIDVNDLRFTDEEAIEYLDMFAAGAMGADDRQTVVARCEGWIAGLYLAALGVLRSPDAATFAARLGKGASPVGEYIVSEVLSGLTPQMREFLLVTSILETMSPEVCDAVGARSDSARMLQALRGRGLFVRRGAGDAGSWHHHALFREVLQSLLALEFDEAQLQQLHRRAAHSYREAGEYADAIRHAIAARDYGLVRVLVDEGGTALLSQEPARLSALLSSMPDDEMASWPEGRSLELWTAAARADIPGLERIREREVPSPESVTSAADAALSFLRGDLDGIRQALSDPPPGLGKHLAAVGGAYVATAEDRFEDGAGLLSTVLAAGGGPLETAMAMAALAWNRVRVGRLREGAGYAVRSIEIAERARTRWFPVVTWAELALAHVDYDHGRLEEAYRRTAYVVEAKAVDSGLFVEARILAARIAWAMGRRDAAVGLLADATLSPAGPIADPYALRVSLSQALLCLLDRDPRLAESWVPDWRKRVERGPHTKQEQLLLARLLVAHDLPDDAIGFLVQEPEAGHAPSIRYVIEAEKLTAMAMAAKNDPGAALRLEVAYSMAEPYGLVQTFREDAYQLPAVHPQSEIGADSATSDQSWLGPSYAVSATSQATAVIKMAERLTEREFEVLRYLPTRLSNREIAHHLFVSLNTVKTHVKAIYRKLGVRSRNEAVTAAVSLRLLD